MRTVFIGLTLMLAGCAREAAYHALPAQHAPLVAEAALDYGEYMRMSGERPEAYFVNDIGRDEGTDWRWTEEEPELRFALRSAANRKFRMLWRLHPQTFADTGPVTLEFYINGQLLHRERYAQPGSYVFEKPVPAAWLPAMEPTLVRIKVLNPWPTSEPGLSYGIVLHEAGFVQQ